MSETRGACLWTGMSGTRLWTCPRREVLAFPQRMDARGKKRALAAAQRAEAATRARGGPPLEGISNLASPKPGTMAHLESWTGTAPVKEDLGRKTLAAEIARRLEADAPRSAAARELETGALGDVPMLPGAPGDLPMLPDGDLPVPPDAPGSPGSLPEFTDDAVAKNREEAQRRWKEGSILSADTPDFDLADYLTRDQMKGKDSAQTREDFLQLISDTINWARRSEDATVVANMDGKVIHKLISSGPVGPVMFAVYRANVAGVQLEMLEERWLNELHTFDTQWRDYMIRLLTKLKNNPNTLTDAEQDDIRFGKKGSTNRYTYSGRQGVRHRKKGDIIFDQDGNVMWLQVSDPVPARSVTPPPVQSVPDYAPPTTTYTGSGAGAKVASLIVVPTRPNSCHAEVKLYGRFMKNPLTEITSAAMFKNTIYFQPTAEAPAQTTLEKEYNLLPEARAQNNLRLPALCQTSASYPRPQLSDPRVNKGNSTFMVTPPDNCTGMPCGYTVSLQGTQAPATNVTPKAYAMLRFEVVEVTGPDGVKRSGDDGFIDQVQIVSSAMDHLWRGASAPRRGFFTRPTDGTGEAAFPLAMQWIDNRALVVQWFESPEEADSMLRAVVNDIGALEGDGWKGDALKKISFPAAQQPGDLFTLTLHEQGGPRILHAPVYAVYAEGSDYEQGGPRILHAPVYAEGSDYEHDLPFAGYNWRYVSDDGFPNTPEGYSPSGCYVDAFGNEYGFQQNDHFGDMLRFQDQQYVAFEKQYNLHTGTFDEQRGLARPATGQNRGVLWWTENRKPTSHNFGVDPDWIKPRGEAQMFPPIQNEKPFLFDLHILQRAAWEAGRKERGGYDAPPLEEPPGGLNEKQKIVWFARQIVHHIKVWMRDYEVARGYAIGTLERSQKMMQLRNRPHFDFVRPPTSGSPGYNRLRPILNLELKDRQRALRNATLCPRRPAFCDYELPGRTVVDSSQTLYRRWGNNDVRHRVPPGLEATSLVRRVVHFDKPPESLGTAVVDEWKDGKVHVRRLGEWIQALQYKEDNPMNTVNNYQHHDAMQTGHASLAFRATTTDGQPVETAEMSKWMKSAKLTLGEAVQEFIDKHYGLFYYTTSLMHDNYDDLGLPERKLEEGERVVHSQVALRPLGLDADARNRMGLAEVAEGSAIKKTHANLKPRSVRDDAGTSREPSIGPGSLKVVVRFDTSGMVGFGGADSFLGLVSSEDAFAAVPRSETQPWETEQPGSARHYAVGDPAVEGTYSKITIAQMNEKVRPLEALWRSAPEWWKKSAAVSDREDSKFLPIDEVCEPADQTKERSKLFRRFMDLGGANNDSSDPNALPEPLEPLPEPLEPLPEPLDLLPGPVDPIDLGPTGLGPLDLLLDTDAGDKRGERSGGERPEAKKAKPESKKRLGENPQAQPKKLKPESDTVKIYPPRSNPKNLSLTTQGRVDRDTFWSSIYITIYDYDDFVIAKAACDEAFSTLMHANPHWYHFKDEYELRGGGVQKRATWQPWVPTSGVDGDTCTFGRPRSLYQEDQHLANYFPFLEVYPTREVAGQHMWGDGCSKRVPGDVGKFAQRPVGRFWNSWMHDRARFGTSDETARAFEQEVGEFQAAFERFTVAKQREDQTSVLELVVNAQIARQLEDSRFVTWMELLFRHPGAGFADASLVFALAEAGERLVRVRRALYSFEEHRTTFTAAQRAELLQLGLRSLHCVCEVPGGEYTSLADGLYSHTPSLREAVQTVLSGFCRQPPVSMRVQGSDGEERDILADYYSSDNRLEDDGKGGTRAKQWIRDLDNEWRVVLPHCELYNLEPLPVPTPEPAAEPVTEPATEPATEPVTEPAAEPATGVSLLFVPAEVKEQLVARAATSDNRNGALDELRDFASNVSVNWQGGFVQQMAAIQLLGTRLRNEIKKDSNWMEESKSLPLVRLLAERLSQDSILAARQTDTSVGPPVIGGLVLNSVDAESERDMRARVVMSVIRIADPFLRETLLLERLLNTGIEEDEVEDATRLLPPGTDVLRFVDYGAYRALSELQALGAEGSEINSVTYEKDMVEAQISLLERGLQYPPASPVEDTVRKVRKINEWWEGENTIFDPAETVYNRAQGHVDPPPDYDSSSDLGLWGYGLDPLAETFPGRGATEYELLRGNLYDGRLNYLTSQFSGGEVYGPKGAYVRYVYDMVRPLFGKDRDRLDEHVSNQRRTFDLVGRPADDSSLPGVPVVMPVPYNVFRKTTLAHNPYLDLGAEQLPHPGVEGNHGTLSTRPEFVDSADLRYPLQSMLQDANLLAPQPALQVEESALLSSEQFRKAYVDYVEYERREVMHAATEEQRGELERDFESRHSMEFPKGCVPYLGALQQ